MRLGEEEEELPVVARRSQTTMWAPPFSTTKKTGIWEGTMADKVVYLDIPILLPEVQDEKDQCVARLQEQLAQHRGILKVDVTRQNGQAQLRVHFDADMVSLAQVQRWAEQAGAQIRNRYRHATVRITDMDCADCALSIEHILRRRPGIVDVSVNYAAEKMWVEFDSTETSLEAIIQQVEGLGYTVEKEEGPQPWWRRHWKLLLSVASGVFLVVGYVGETLLGLPPTVALVLYVLAYLTGGYDATRHGIKAALNLRFDIDFLMVVAAIGAAILGEWKEGALLLFLFSLGHALEHYAMDRARHAIEALGHLTPRTARVRRDGREEEVPVEKLLRGDVVIVRPGERIPIDGEVIAGHSAVDQSPITGESVPVEKEPGDTVFAGTVNGEGTLEIRVTRLAKDTTLARIIRMVEEAQAQRSPTQIFTARFTRVFVPTVLVGVVLMIFVPPLLGILSWGDAFLRGMTILVAASPCALALATPSTVLSGIAQAARNGVLIKGGAHLENLGALDVIAFDKTGTITRGEPEVTTIIPLNGATTEEVLRYAAAVESRSTHPLARAILRKAEEMGGLTWPEVADFQSVTGRGLRARLDGQEVAIGNLRLFTTIGEEVPPEVVRQVEALEARGQTTMVLKVGNTFMGIIGLADRPRSEARPTMERLRALGIRMLVMLTGDNERVAAAIAEEVGLTDYRANLLPDQKAQAIQELRAQHGDVAMVGDGVNDAPALATATVGIAMGGAGTDVALETADVALMADDLSKLPFAVGLSRQAQRVIRENLVVSLGVIAILIPAAVFGLAGIGIAIVFHEGSTLIVVGNALRLLRYQLN